LIKSASYLSFPMRLMLDTNVLLTGVLLPFSASGEVLSLIRDGVHAGYVIQNVLDELQSVIRKECLETGVDVWPIFQAALPSMNILFLPEVDNSLAAQYESVNGSYDKAVACGAFTYGASICSNDIKDLIPAKDYGIGFVTPDELSARPPDSLPFIFPGMWTDRNEGSYYIEIGGLNWINQRFPKTAQERFYFFDDPGVGACYFRACDHTIIFQLDNGMSVMLKHGPILTEHLPLRLVASYKSTIGAMVHTSTGKSKSVKNKSMYLIDFRRQQVHAGSSRYLRHQLSGNILKLFGMPVLLGHKEANRIFAGKTVALPWDRMSIKNMIRLRHALRMQ
jgi:hypothetical protein